MIQVADGDRQSIGDVVRRRDSRHGEQQLDHLLDLVLLRTPVANDGPFHFGRRVLGDLDFRLDGSEHRHASHVAKRQSAPSVHGGKQILDGD
jgi:hypothetical protein